MAVLDATNRDRIRRAFMRDNAEPAGFTKADLLAAVDATDAWIDSNQTSFNSALPVTFRTNATLAQKTLLFCYVGLRRAGLLRVQEDG